MEFYFDLLKLDEQHQQNNQNLDSHGFIQQENLRLLYENENNNGSDNFENSSMDNSNLIHPNKGHSSKTKENTIEIAKRKDMNVGFEQKTFKNPKKQEETSFEKSLIINDKSLMLDNFHCSYFSALNSFDIEFFKFLESTKF